MKLALHPLTFVPILAIGLLTLSETPATADSGFQGSYGGVPIDLGKVLKNNSTLIPTPENLANAAIRNALQVTGITPEFNPEMISPNPLAGMQFQGRYDLPNSPLSVRGSLYVEGNARAVMPSVTYDLPIANNTNIYAGAGLSIINAEAGKTTPLGSRTGIVVTTGLETEISRGVVLYGDAKLVPSNKEPGNSKLRYQVGVGYRF